MICPKCKGNYVVVQVVSSTKQVHHSVIWWLIIGWWWVPVKWIFLTLPALIIHIFAPKKTKSVEKTICICQECGNKWEI